MIAIRYLLLILTGFLISGCRDAKLSLPARNQPEQPAEPWSTLPPEQWPQLVLTSEADFKGHSPLRGASSFLVRAEDGRILAATASHLLGPNRGVEPTVTPERLSAVLPSWRMFPRTKPNDSVSIAGLGFEPPVKKGLDWLLLTISGTPDKLPSEPLTLRSKPVAIGEEVFLVGVPYSEPGRAQNVYRGRVTERAYKDRFRYTIDPPVNIRGFSGAPIVDRNGLVVGVMTIWFEPKMQGDDFLEAGGEDSASVLNQLEMR